MEIITNLDTYQKLLLAIASLMIAFLTYVSMTIKKYKKRKMTFSEKFWLYFGQCPCGGKIETWSAGRKDCHECGEKYYH